MEDAVHQCPFIPPESLSHRAKRWEALGKFSWDRPLIKVFPSSWGGIKMGIFNSSEKPIDQKLITKGVTPEIDSCDISDLLLLIPWFQKNSLNIFGIWGIIYQMSSKISFINIPILSWSFLSFMALFLILYFLQRIAFGVAFSRFSPPKLKKIVPFFHQNELYH